MKKPTLQQAVFVRFRDFRPAPSLFAWHGETAQIATVLIILHANEEFCNTARRVYLPIRERRHYQSVQRHPARLTQG